MRVITFSRQFPIKHARQGEPTYFVEKIWKGLWDTSEGSHNPLYPYWMNYDQVFPCTNDRKESIHEHEPKHHTIRAGDRWKVGDIFSPRCWSGAPYRSKQIQFAPDIKIKKTWDYETDVNGVPSINGYYLPERINDMDAWEYLALNDGLSLDDFISWFRVHPNKNKEDWSFKGQIICWNENIDYE